MWWLIIRTPNGVRCWPAGDDQSAHPTVVNAGRILAGMPADDDPIGSAWDVQLSVGEPPAQLLRSATVGTLRDLRDVGLAAVDAYNAQRLQRVRVAAADRLATLLTEVSDPLLADVLARPEVAARVRPA